MRCSFVVGAAPHSRLRVEDGRRLQPQDLIRPDLIDTAICLPRNHGLVGMISMRTIVGTWWCSIGHGYDDNTPVCMQCNGYTKCIRICNGGNSLGHCLSAFEAASCPYHGTR
ncbi:hypothetical protein TWF718_002960 [Orbilia javanica]|uniref:Uncharacterized protein n=1 Tax=Orbilia javanica TaxID=47235 RepID=A0AAN8MLM0_9PEZI